MSVYRSSPHGAGGESKPLVIHCSDPRYQPHFQEFLDRGLSLGHYSLIAVPGGPQCLAIAEFLPKFGWAASRWIKFMETVARPERLVLIAHDDCRWYLEMRFAPHAGRLREKQIADLRSARAWFLERYPGTRVDLYHAAMEDNRVAFEDVT